LQGALRRQTPHVVHFVGHGGFSPTPSGAGGVNAGGALAFCASDGKAAIVSGGDLALLLDGCDSLRLVYLSACEGAVTGTASAFAGVAQQLLQKGAPTVLAMQAPLREDHAARFSQEFYRALADGYGIHPGTATVVGGVVGFFVFFDGFELGPEPARKARRGRPQSI